MAKITKADLKGLKLSKNFNADEFLDWRAGEIRLNWELIRALQLLRDYIGLPIKINSGYRSEQTNASLPNASKTSDHMKGCAADIEVAGKSQARLYSKIQELAQLNKEFDVLIRYCYMIVNSDDAVHISTVPAAARNNKWGGKAK